MSPLRLEEGKGSPAWHTVLTPWSREVFPEAFAGKSNSISSVIFLPFFLKCETPYQYGNSVSYYKSDLI